MPPMSMKTGHGHAAADEEGLDMLDVAAEALNRGGRAGAANVEDVMALYVTAQRARETAASCGGDDRYDGWPLSRVGDACAIDGVA